MIKNYLKSYAYLLGLIIVMTFIFSIFNYFFMFSTKGIKILIPIISMFISTIILGRKAKAKAYIEGIKFSSIYIIMAIVLSLITKNPFTFKLILSYMMILLSGIVGAMIGINLNKNR